MSEDTQNRPPLPPFDEASALSEVRLAENGWNSRDAERVALAYTPGSVWRNRVEFVTGRTAIVALLSRKWARELGYRLVKELWAWRRAGRVADAEQLTAAPTASKPKR